MKVYVYTLGCRLNQCESEAIADSFSKSGFDVIKDYDTFNKEITRLQDENARLRSKVDELNRQVEVGSSIPRSASSQPVSNATNMDILKRLSNLERRVFGSQLNSGDRDDSHLL